MNEPATPTDPGAIDQILDAARHGVYCSDDIPTLIVAVEALREHVAELEHGWDVWCKTAEQQAKMRKAEEAHVAKLARALEALMNDVEKCARDSFATSAETFETDWEEEDPTGCQLWKQARAALSVTPAEALERAEAIKDVVTAARHQMSSDFDTLMSLTEAVDVLDALGKEETCT